MLHRYLWLGMLLLAVSAWPALAVVPDKPEEVWEAYRGSQFHLPCGVSVNENDGTCWVADTLNNEVAKLSPEGIELWRRGGFDRPYAVAVNPETGEAWVTDTFHNRVARLNAVLDEVKSIGGFALPQALAMDKVTRSLWVMDGANITHLDREGTQLGRYSPGGSWYPVSLAADSTDDTCWASFCYHCPPPPGTCPDEAPVFVHIGSDGKVIQKADQWLASAISVNTATQRVWASFDSYREEEPLSGLVQFTRDMKVDKVFSEWGQQLQAHSTIGDGSCWVATATGIQLVGRNDDVLWQSDSFWAPYGISATHDQDILWVADTENSQVVKLQLRPRPFPDVPPRLWSWSEIGACAEAGIVVGYDDGCYHWERSVTRDQMAVYIARGLSGGAENVPSGPTMPSFSDVPPDFWAYRYIEYCVEHGVVKGYSDGTYDPRKQLDRGQMAAFIARAVAPESERPDLPSYVAPSTPSFPDVPTTFWDYKHVEYLHEGDLGVVKGYPDGLYHPEYICTRDQMAVYIARAFQLPPWPPAGAGGGN